MKVTTQYLWLRCTVCAACQDDENGSGPCTCREWEEAVSIEADVRDGLGTIPNYFEVLSVRGATGRACPSFVLDVLASGKWDDVKEVLWHAFTVAEAAAEVDAKLLQVETLLRAQVRLGQSMGATPGRLTSYLNQVLAVAVRAKGEDFAPPKQKRPALQLVKGGV